MSADVGRMKALPPDPPPGANADELLVAINEAMLHLRDPKGEDQQAWRLKLHRLTGALEKLPDESARGKQTLPPTLKLEGTLNHLTEEEREYVKTKLTEEADFFATKQYPGRIKGTEPIDIDTGDNPPVTSRYRQLSPLQQATVDEYVSKLLDAGIVEPGYGPWSSPLQVVPKADGKWRPVVDLRRVNKFVTRDSYPMPLAEETINRLAGSKWLSKIDLQSAFFSLPLAEGARDKTAFMTRGKGLLRFTALPMGLTTAPQKFQRAVDQALGALQTTCCVSFFDDICVYSNGDLVDHMEQCMKVIKALRHYGFTGNPEKCVFAQHELEFLGHTVSQAGVSMQEKKVGVMLDYNRPTSQRELLGFLALTSYYRKFISNYAHIAAPLYTLMQDDKESGYSPQSRKARLRTVWEGDVWTREHEQAFRTLKGALVTAPVLAMPNKTGRFVLACDASDVAWGAVLAQVGEDGKEHPIAYYSKKLLESEQNWNIWERECSCCVWAADKCRPYLLGNKFDLITDSKVVHSLLDKSTWPSKRANWVMRLSEFDFDVKHRKGELNPVADFLSRWATSCMDAYAGHENRRVSAQINVLQQALDETEHLIGDAGGKKLGRPKRLDRRRKSPVADPVDSVEALESIPELLDSDEDMPDAFPPEDAQPGPDGPAEGDADQASSSANEQLDVPFPCWLAEQQRADPYINGIILKEEAALRGEPLPDEGSSKPKVAREYRLLNRERILTTKTRIRGHERHSRSTG